MTHTYSETIAAHYAAYRPPLHKRILERVLSDAGQLSNALDVGCGTGRSSLALTEFCERVFAIDPSPSMLAAAAPHDRITYLRGAGENIPLPDHSIDLVTFAGSLSYANFDATAGEVIRVCRRGALVVAYDFDVLIEKSLRPFGIAAPAHDSTYDHRANFSGVSAFDEMMLGNDRIQFDVPATNLAHVLLADTARHEAFVRRYMTATPLQKLTAELASKSQSLKMEADIFFSAYLLRGIASRTVDN